MISRKVESRGSTIQTEEEEEEEEDKKPKLKQERVVSQAQHKLNRSCGKLWWQYQQAGEEEEEVVGGEEKRRISRGVGEARKRGEDRRTGNYIETLGGGEEREKGAGKTVRLEFSVHSSQRRRRRRKRKLEKKKKKQGENKRAEWQEAD